MKKQNQKGKKKIRQNVKLTQGDDDRDEVEAIPGVGKIGDESQAEPFCRHFPHKNKGEDIVGPPEQFIQWPNADKFFAQINVFEAKRYAAGERVKKGVYECPYMS